MSEEYEEVQEEVIQESPVVDYNDKNVELVPSERDSNDVDEVVVEIAAVSPDTFLQRAVGLKGKELVSDIIWDEIVYPTVAEYEAGLITSTTVDVMVKDAKPEPVMKGKKGEKYHAKDEDGNERFVNKTYAKPVSLYIDETEIMSYLKMQGVTTVVGKLLGPIVAAGRNKNIDNPVPDGFKFTLAHVQAFYDSLTWSDATDSLLGQGWAPPTAKLNAAAAIAAACPIEVDDTIVAKYFSVASKKFDGAKATTYGIGDVATFKSLTTFVGKHCVAKGRLPKSDKLNVGIQVLNQLQGGIDKKLEEIAKLKLTLDKFTPDQQTELGLMEENYSNYVTGYNHVLCALNAAHAIALRKEALAAAKKAKTDTVEQSDDMLTMFLAGDSIADELAEADLT